MSLTLPATQGMLKVGLLAPETPKFLSGCLNHIGLIMVALYSPKKFHEFLFVSHQDNHYPIKGTTTLKIGSPAEA